jgi:hypothetical protein
MQAIINKITTRFFVNNVVMLTVLALINKLSAYVNKRWGWFFTNGNKEPYVELYPWREEWGIEQ